MTQNTYKEFGEKLKMIRQKAKETIDEVSAAIEMEAMAINNLEQGKAKPSET